MQYTLRSVLYNSTKKAHEGQIILFNVGGLDVGISVICSGPIFSAVAWFVPFEKRVKTGRPE